MNDLCIVNVNVNFLFFFCRMPLRLMRRGTVSGQTTLPPSASSPMSLPSLGMNQTVIVTLIMMVCVCACVCVCVCVSVSVSVSV